jgi:hypothetical protein
MSFKLTLERQFISVFPLDFVSFRWISFSYFTDFVGFRFLALQISSDFVFVSFLSLPVLTLNNHSHIPKSY